MVILRPQDPNVKVRYIQQPGRIIAGGSVKTVFFLLVPAARIHAPKTDLKIDLVLNNKIIETVSTTFVGPAND